MSGPGRTKRAPAPAQSPSQSTSASQGGGPGNAARAQDLQGFVSNVTEEAPGILALKMRLDQGSPEDVGVGADFQAGGPANLWGKTTKVGKGFVRGRIETPDLTAKDAVESDPTVRFRSLPKAPPASPGPDVQAVPLTPELVQEMSGLSDQRAADQQAALEAEQAAHLEGADGGMADEEADRHRALEADMKAAQDEEYSGRGP